MRGLFLLLGCVAIPASYVLTAAEARAQIFLSDDNQSSSAGRSSSGSAGRSGSSVILAPEYDSGFQTRARGPRQENAGSPSSSVVMGGTEDRAASTRTDRYERLRNKLNDRKTSGSAENGVTYSIEEYNKRLAAQRESANRSTSSAGSSRRIGYYPESYVNRNVDRVRTNPLTGGYATAKEINDMISARQAYYEKYPDLTPKKRSRVEELFFNKHGYYRDDKDVLVEGDGSTRSRSSRDVGGSSVNLDSDRISTSNRYLERFQRYQNYGSGSDR